MRNTLMRSNPYSLVNSWVRDDFLTPLSYGSNLDVYQKEDDYFVEVELPGFKKEEISIEFNNDILKIVAQTLAEEEDETKHYFYRSRKASSYERHIRFNNVDASAIDASYNDGVLKIKLPAQTKTEVTNRIEVK